MKKTIKRVLTFVLCMAMALSSLEMPVRAENPQEGGIINLTSNDPNMQFLDEKKEPIQSFSVPEYAQVFEGRFYVVIPDGKTIKRINCSADNKSIDARIKKDKFSGLYNMTVKNKKWVSGFQVTVNFEVVDIADYTLTFDTGNATDAESIALGEVTDITNGSTAKVSNDQSYELTVKVPEGRGAAVYEMMDGVPEYCDYEYESDNTYVFYLNRAFEDKTIYVETFDVCDVTFLAPCRGIERVAVATEYTEEEDDEVRKYYDEDEGRTLWDAEDSDYDNSVYRVKKGESFFVLVTPDSRSEIEFFNSDSTKVERVASWEDEYVYNVYKITPAENDTISISVKPVEVQVELSDDIEEFNFTANKIDYEEAKSVLNCYGRDSGLNFSFKIPEDKLPVVELTYDYKVYGYNEDTDENYVARTGTDTRKISYTGSGNGRYVYDWPTDEDTNESYNFCRYFPRIEEEKEWFDEEDYHYEERYGTVSKIKISAADSVRLAFEGAHFSAYYGDTEVDKSMTVAKGSDVLFDIYPENGYIIRSVKVDGRELECDEEGRYPIKNIGGDTTVVVEATEAQEYTLTFDLPEGIHVNFVEGGYELVDNKLTLKEGVKVSFRLTAENSDLLKDIEVTNALKKPDKFTKETIYVTNVTGGNKTVKVGTHEHQPGSGWKSDATHHWHVCSCGQKFDKAEHTFTDGVCTCGYKAHVHEAGTEYKFDNNNHWNECACGEKMNVTPHTFTDGVCACGYKAHVHEAGTEYKSDDNSHWNECACGEKMNVTNHAYTDGVCVCGRKEPHVHTYTTYGYDANSHWKICPCGDVTEKEAHVLNNGVCVCGYEEKEGENGAEIKGEVTDTYKDYQTVDESEIIKLSAGDVTLTQTSAIYTGKPISPKVKVSNGGKTLKEGADYKVSYSRNTNAGVAIVTVMGVGSYEGRIDKEFKITGKPINKLKVVTKTVAAGKSIPSSAVSVYDGQIMLQEGMDYTCSAVEAVKGNNTVEIKAKEGSSNYTGSLSAKVTAIELNAAKNEMLIADAVVLLEANSSEAGKWSKESETLTTVFDGTNRIPKVTVKYGDNMLAEKTDYTVSFKNHKNAGTAYAIIKGKGKYKGQTYASFEIKASLGFEAKVNKGKALTYTGKTQTPNVEVKDGAKKLAKNKDYVLEYISNINAGKGYVKIKGIGNYEGVEKTYPFTIQKQLIKKAGIKIKNSGNITLKYAGKTLKENVDYKVTIEDSSTSGKKKVTITGLKNFDDSPANAYVKDKVKAG